MSDISQMEKFRAIIEACKWPLITDPSNDYDIREGGMGMLSSWDGYNVDSGPYMIVNGSIWTWQTLLFNHDFACDLYGEELEYYDEIDAVAKNWTVKLQEAIVSSDPITYFYNSIPRNKH